MKHIVMFSGGAASFVAGRRIERRLGNAVKAGEASITWLFTDTMIEDEDLYRFLGEVSVGRDLVTIADGRDPWGVFFDERFLGNTRIDPCSKILKRKLARKWVTENCELENTTLYVGISWDEEHRMEKVLANWRPWKVEAPLCEEPYLLKDQILEEVRVDGFELSNSYDLGFPHDNCGGFCIKAGQAHFALLLKHRRDRYLHHENREQDFIKFIGKSVAILRDRRGGKTRPMTLREFRHRIEAGRKYDLFEWGGCGCFA